jgi:hypothetical protein
MNPEKRAYRIGRAAAKWRAAGGARLGIPEPTTYTQVDGIEAKHLYIGPDGRGGWVVVRDGRRLFESAVRKPAMDYFDRVKWQ